MAMRFRSGRARPLDCVHRVTSLARVPACAHAAGEPTRESPLVATLAAPSNDAGVDRLSVSMLGARRCGFLRLGPRQGPSLVARGSRPAGDHLVRRSHEAALGA
jgi:hypothetical protein